MSEKTPLGLTPPENFVDERDAELIARRLTRVVDRILSAQQQELVAVLQTIPGFYSKDEKRKMLARGAGRGGAEAYRLQREEGCLNDLRCDAPGIRLYFLDDDGWRGIIEATLKMFNIEYKIQIAQEAEPTAEDGDLEERLPEVYVVDLPKGIFLSSDESSAAGVDIYARHKKPSAFPAVLPYVPDGPVILSTDTGRQSGFLRVEGYNGKPTYWHNPRYLWDGRSLPGVG